MAKRHEFQTLKEVLSYIVMRENEAWEEYMNTKVDLLKHDITSEQYQLEQDIASITYGRWFELNYLCEIFGIDEDLE